jgi:hypothetical protein
MIQLGLAIGLIYVAFVTAWLWLTRVRWNLR